MSPIHHAPLRAAALCAVCLLVVNPVHALQGGHYFAAQHGDLDGDATEDPTEEDFTTQILRRLDEQAAENQRLKEQGLPVPAMGDAQEREARQDYGADTGPESAMTRLQQR